MTTHRIRVALSAFVFFALVTPALLAQEPAPDDPSSILEEADRLAWLKNWTRAEPLFARAEELFRERGDARNVLYARIGRLRGQLPRLSILETSNRLAELLEDPLVQNDAELRLRVLTVKGDTDMDLDSDLARRDWTEALELARSLGDRAWEARATGELGIVDFLQGDSAAAMTKMSTALTSATASGDIGAQIRYLTLTGSGVAEFGNIEMGLGFLDNALAVAATHPDTRNPVMTYTAKAKALDLAGRTDEANDLLQQAFGTAAEVGALGAQADLLAQMALLSVKSGNPDLAIEQLQEAARLAEAAGGSRPAAIAHMELAKLYLAAGDLTAAEAAAMDSVEATRQIGDRFLLPRHLSQLANVKVQREQYPEAAALYEEAADILNGLLIHAPSPESKASLIGVMDEVYLGRFRLAASRMNDLDGAFAVVEQARGRALADLIASRPMIPETQPAELTEVEKQISALQIQLLRAETREERREILDELLRTEWTIGPIAVSTNRSWMRVQLEPVSIEGLQALLHPDEVFLEFVLDDPVSYVIVVTREGRSLRRLPAGSAIAGKAEDLLTAVRDGTAINEGARQLYTDLMGPIPELAGKARLIAVPDGVLHHLPFELLIDPDGRRLIETHVVSYIQSGTVLALLRDKPPLPEAERPSVLAVSTTSETDTTVSELGAVDRGIFDLEGIELEPLPGANDEVRVVGEAFGDGSVVMFGEQAQESAVKAEPLDQYRVLHFAVHGLVSTSFPERSALVLHSDPDAGEDGLLQAREVSRLTLDADLVTLSACDTGSGRVRGQEGVAALVRPFLIAGARSVVANLWQADDDFTLRLMTEFYQRLAAGADKGSALRDAKLEVIRRYGDEATPFRWAGFVLVGEGSNPIVGSGD